MCTAPCPPPPSLRLSHGCTCSKADEDFEEELQEDVKGECEKYGKITHVKVDKNSLVRAPPAAYRCPVPHGD
jgi:hypothetical protein